MPLGELSTVAQLTGLDAVKLIGLIVRSANTARMHKKNCRQFARHLKLIGNLLRQLNITELKRYPETREPLEQLEDALRRSYILVDSCQGRSYLYLLAMGWNIVYQFRKAQNEIDLYLKLVPLITLVDNARVRERLEYIERDQNEYTLDEEEERVQGMILDPDMTHTTTSVLKKTLSCSYPRCSFDEALRKENEKLRMELQLSQASLDVQQCEVIQRLLDVTATASSVCQAECDGSNKELVLYNGGQELVLYNGGQELVLYNGGGSNQELVLYNGGGGYTCAQKNDEGVGFEVQQQQQEEEEEEDYPEKKKKKKKKKEKKKKKIKIKKKSGADTEIRRVQLQEWRTDLLGCCSEPCLCLKTCFYPCGTFSRIATVAENRYISPGESCNELLAYSLILSCCCYTCCVRRRLRIMLNINGGVFDDFLSHLMCCCCALVQEWREIEIRGAYYSNEKTTRTNPPATQFMES